MNGPASLSVDSEDSHIVAFADSYLLEVSSEGAHEIDPDQKVESPESKAGGEASGLSVTVIRGLDLLGKGIMVENYLLSGISI